MSDLYRIILEAITGFTAGGVNALAVFLRVGAAMAFLPGIGEAVIPVRVKLALTLGITVLILGQGAEEIQGEAAGINLLSNVVVGLAIGLSFRALIFAVEICGHIISNMISMAQIFPNGAEVSPVVSTLMKYAGILILMQLGLLERYCEALSLSYEGAAATDLAVSTEIFAHILSKTAQSLDIALSLSLPFMMFSFLYNVVLGVMNRIMPALMVHLIFAPAMALCGISLLAIVISYTLLQWLKMTSW